MVKNAQQALHIACEMEKRAVKMYQRGAMLFPHLAQQLRQCELEEQTHLRCFQEMGESLGGVSQEERMLLSAYAAQVIFPGGLMEASRENAFADLAAFLAYAAQQEEEAVRYYTEFAAKCQQDDARQMFLSIAEEEKGHYAALVARRNEL